MGFGEVERNGKDRQLVQDFVTHDSCPLDAVDREFEAVDLRFDLFLRKIDRQHAQTLATLQRIENTLHRQVLERLARLESKNVA
jgi:hypothetical protein